MAPPTRYWAGVGPKVIQCTSPNCMSTIPIGALVHKQYKLNQKPTCWTCGKAYVLPPGAERPYLPGIGLNGHATPKGKGKGKGKDEAAIEQKDKEINYLKGLLKEAKVVLPNNEQTSRKDLEGLKAAREVMLKQGLPTNDLDTKIQELEADTKTSKLALPAIEARLTAAQAKVQKCIGRYKHALEQLKQAKEAGTEAVKLVEDLEAQKTEALAGQGYEPKTTVELEKVPDNLDQAQQEQWKQAVKMHEEQQKQIAKQAAEVLAEHLQAMHENFKRANAEAKATAQADNAPASGDAETREGLSVMEDDDDPELDAEFPEEWDEDGLYPKSLCKDTTNEAEQNSATKRKSATDADTSASSGATGDSVANQQKAKKRAARDFLQKVQAAT